MGCPRRLSEALPKLRTAWARSRDTLGTRILDEVGRGLRPLRLGDMGWGGALPDLPGLSIRDGGGAITDGTGAHPSNQTPAAEGGYLPGANEGRRVKC